MVQQQSKQSPEKSGILFKRPSSHISTFYKQKQMNEPSEFRKTLRNRLEVRTVIISLCL